MMLALVFRGVAFEFRFRDADHKTFWDDAFNYGSAVATLKAAGNLQDTEQFSALISLDSPSPNTMPADL